MLTSASVVFLFLSVGCSLWDQNYSTLKCFSFRFSQKKKKESTVHNPSQPRNDEFNVTHVSGWLCTWFESLTTSSILK